MNENASVANPDPHSQNSLYSQILISHGCACVNAYDKILISPRSVCFVCVGRRGDEGGGGGEEGEVYLGEGCSPL